MSKEIHIPPAPTQAVGAAGPLDSSTIDQFCARHRMGRTTYFKIRSHGYGPKELRYGRLVRITAEAEREWLTRMQSGTTAA